LKETDEQQIRLHTKQNTKDNTINTRQKDNRLYTKHTIDTRQ